MYEDLKGKTALITGSGKRTGIGYAIAEMLASCGTNVIVADLGRGADSSEGVRTGTEQEMREIAADLAERFRVRALAVDVDVTSGGSIRRMVERVREDFDHVEVLCNNAGASFGGGHLSPQSPSRRRGGNPGRTGGVPLRHGPVRRLPRGDRQLGRKRGRAAEEGRPGVLVGHPGRRDPRTGPRIGLHRRVHERGRRGGGVLSDRRAPVAHGARGRRLRPDLGWKSGLRRILRRNGQVPERRDRPGCLDQQWQRLCLYRTATL